MLKVRWAGFTPADDTWEPIQKFPLWESRMYDPNNERPDSVPIKETARTLKHPLDTGKIRAFGLSNETTFGVAE
jgi:aryl-alcohol dehydrogenase-like predicted oxidoreductase